MSVQEIFFLGMQAVSKELTGERMEVFIFDLLGIVSFCKRPEHCTHENSDEKRCLKHRGHWLAYNLPNTLQDHK
jgi:hypothetical protein